MNLKDKITDIVNKKKGYDPDFEDTPADDIEIVGKRKKAPNMKMSIIVMLIVVALAIIVGLVGFVTDLLWFKDLGYTSVFWKKILTCLSLGIPIFAVATLLMRFYLRTLRNGYFRQIESHEIPNRRSLNIISWVLSVIYGLIVAVFSASTTWLNFLKFLKYTGFDLKDPLFNLDISFYVFKLEYLTQINNIVIGAIIGMVVITLLYYGILLKVRTPDVFVAENDKDEDDPTSEFLGGKIKLDINKNNIVHLTDIAKGKIMVLGVIFYAMLLVQFVLKQFNLLHAHTGVVYGAGFTDVTVTLWAYRIIMLLSLVGAVTFCVHLKKKEIKKLAKVPIAIVGVYALSAVLALGVQNLIVSPDEINKETKYLENNITYTRHAYGLDNITTTTYASDDSLTTDEIAENSQTISNIRINDYEPVQDFYNQTQSIRQYYTFNDVDIDRYTNSDGSVIQTYLSAREIDEEKISDTWLNQHLKYTHGYGIAVSQVNTVTSSGQPDVIVGNIPPESSVDDVTITRPEIYFGEKTDNYVIVNTKEKEFDYPDGSENKYCTYEGDSGVKLNFFNRILYAIKMGSIKILVSGNITKDSAILYNRNVVKRVQKIMPYLDYETDPYLTCVDGKLYWIIDGYTTSSYYPYSEPYSGTYGTTNYIRNSIKAVVDAYTGDVNFYVVDEEDPIAQTYMKIYPKLFKTADKMPEGLMSHIRYPNNLFKIQANVYTKYHMDNAKVFYQKEDMWDIAHQIYGTEEVEMSPSYYTFKLPDSDSAEFINMIPFTPKSKQNMTAIMMARNDGDHYGELVVYTFPKGKTVYGPMQIEAQIDQNTEISKEFSLWNQSGSTYRRGDLFVIPIGSSLLYVEPVYLEASNEAIPEVKRVIVAYGDQIAYESTLAGALESLFGASYDDSTSGIDTGTSTSSSDLSVKELAQKASEAYQNAVEAQKSGDWTAYGKYLKEMESYLNKLANS